jgi:hypothetical protein
MLGALGNAIIFFMTLILGIIVAIYLLAYTAHCFLVVLQGTTAGLDEVTWPDELIFDWLLRALHLIGLAAVWVVPAGILWRALRTDLLHDDGLLSFVVIVVPVFWLTFPFGVLSSLSSTLQWVPFRWVILRQMLRLFPATCGFYASTALLLAVVVVPWYFTFTGNQWFLIPVAALLTGAAGLIYPRLLGRLAWLIGRHMPAPAAPSPKPKAATPGPGGKKKPPRPRRRKGRVRPTKVEDPWKIPDDFEMPPPPSDKPRNPNLPPLPHEIEGYGISTDSDPAEPRPLPKRRPPRGRGEHPPESAYEVEAYNMDPQPPVKPVFFPPPDPSAPAIPPSPGEENPAVSRQPAPAVEVSDLEMRLAQRPKPLPIPARPLVSGVYTFPAYFRSQQAWFRMSIGWFLLGFLVNQIVASFRTLPQ